MPFHPTNKTVIMPAIFPFLRMFYEPFILKKRQAGFNGLIRFRQVLLPISEGASIICFGPWPSRHSVQPGSDSTCDSSSLFARNVNGRRPAIGCSFERALIENQLLPPSPTANLQSAPPSYRQPFSIVCHSHKRVQRAIRNLLLVPTRKPAAGNDWCSMTARA